LSIVFALALAKCKMCLVHTDCTISGIIRKLQTDFNGDGVVISMYPAVRIEAEKFPPANNFIGAIKQSN